MFTIEIEVGREAPSKPSSINIISPGLHNGNTDRTLDVVFLRFRCLPFTIALRQKPKEFRAWRIELQD